MPDLLHGGSLYNSHCNYRFVKNWKVGSLVQKSFVILSEECLFIHGHVICVEQCHLSY